MNRAIKLLLLVLFFTSCKEKLNNVQDVLAAMEPKEKRTTIDPTVDNLIKGDKGIQVFIPTNALRFKDGTSPSGKVRVELKEFFSVSDFISNNLSTTSDSFLLQTGGMLYISATADGQELIIDPNMSYTIAFPKSDSTNEMELFYGDSTTSGMVNWKPAFIGSEGFSMGYDSLLVDSALYENKIRVCGWLSQYGGNVDWKLNHPDTSIWTYIYKNFKVPDDLIGEFCESDWFVELNLYINPKGKVYNIKHKSKVSEELKLLISNFFDSLPAFDMRSMEISDPAYGYSLYLCCHKEFDQEKYAERFKQKYTQYQDRAIEKMNKGEFGLYVFSATKFGWINCDIFYDDEREKIDFIVTVPSPDSRSYIVFEDIKSIMTGELVDGSFMFRNVPINSKIKVLGIGYSNGKPLLSKVFTTVKKQPFVISGFKEFTLKELEKELNN